MTHPFDHATPAREERRVPVGLIILLWVLNALVYGAIAADAWEVW